MAQTEKIVSWYTPDTLELDDQSLLGRGSKRLCFAFPGNSSLCVKVARPDFEWEVGQRQSFAEAAYLGYLTKRDGTLPDIFPKMLGWVRTDFGPGLVFERVLGLNAFPGKSLRELLEVGAIDAAEARTMMQTLKQSVVNDGLVVSDWNIDNVIPYGTLDSWSLKLIDGFGVKEPGIKCMLFSRIPKLARHRSLRSWKRQYPKVERSIQDPAVGKI